MAGTQRILILFFHPLFHKSRVNRELIAAARRVDGIDVRIMYDLYPDFHIDMKVEQRLLLDHDIILWQHPLYWYSSPSLLKEWIDIVLEHGFAYGLTGRALEGKKIMSAITVGGAREVYQPGGARKYTIPQLLVPFERTVELCHMEYLPPFVVHETYLLDQGGIKGAAEEYERALEYLRDHGATDELLSGHLYMNDFLSKN